MSEKPTYEELEQRIQELEQAESKRKRVEKALRESEEALRENKIKYRAILETTSEGCWILNPELETIEVNESLCKMLGYNRNEILGKTPFDFVDDENRKIFIGQTSKISTIDHRSYEIALKKKNGEDIHTFFNATTIRDAAGKVQSAFAFITDITERKRAEKALRESGAFKNTIIESSPDCIKLLDLEGNLKYMSKGGQEKLEIKDIKVYLNKSWVDFWEGKDTIHARKAVDTAVKGAIGKFRGYSPTETGKPRWWDVVIAPLLGLNGEVEQLLAISRDITETKKMEDDLIQAHKLEAIGELAAGIAHDFNNILSSIIGFTELSLDVVKKGSTLEDNLQEVYTAGKRAKDLVRQILAFARQSEKELKPIQVDSVVKEVLKFMRSSIPTTIKIRQSIKSDSIIMGNATQLYQVLMNICTNAAHAMEAEGGILKTSMKDVKMDGTPEFSKLALKPGHYIEIKVSDTGIGIPPDIIKSIFDPYFTTKGPGEGTGMGLSVVHGIVESYGGKISVDSELGKGTTFTIYLLITRKRKAHQPYESEALPSGTERILFVDDEAPITKMGSQVLERLGYSVTTRTSSVEALKLFRSKPDDFNLVITDMTMPNMNGDKLAVELMKIRPYIPVILCTGYSKKISDETALEIGIKAFLYKPIVKVELAKTVRKVLDDQQQEQTTGRILLIDDDSKIRKLFIQKLAGRGYEMIEACDGKEGLKLYHENRPDLVITDLVMPEKEGIETITELKREFPNVKIIAISGGGRNVPDAYLHIAKNLGAERTFPKPIDWPELIKTVRELLK